MKMRIKWILYGVLCLVLAGVLFFYAGWLLDVSDDTTSSIILDKLSVTKDQTERAIAFRAREIQLAFDVLPA